MSTSLKLAPVNSSNIYARRHSAHACTATETTQNVIPPLPPVPIRPPPVPKRTTLPVLPQSSSIRKKHNPPLNQNVQRKSAHPPPLPPTPKTRAPPFNQLISQQQPQEQQEQQQEEQENTEDSGGKRNINNNNNHNTPTNFPFDNLKLSEVLKKNAIYNKQENTPVPPTPNRMYKQNQQGKLSRRQDSGISTDSFSQNSSPSYTVKGMDTPLIPPKTPTYRILKTSDVVTKIRNPADEQTKEEVNGITKSISTPASLQTIVRFHNGSNMSLHHRILRGSRRPSENYPKYLLLKPRMVYLIVNVIVLTAFFTFFGLWLSGKGKQHVTFVNHTINVTAAPIIIERRNDNPAPGVCLPVIVNFCKEHQLPYNYTIYPNYLGHFGQRDAQIELEVYDAVVDVQCYKLTALFLCTIFVPKCGTNGLLVRPCRGMCEETKRRCGFFLDVFGLTLPKYLECDLFPESSDPNICIGQAEVKAVKVLESRPICPTGFQCDSKRCIPKDWQCDGHIDCKDQTDELNCTTCGFGMIHCGSDKCITHDHMCDGIIDCPWGQDERNCLRLSDTNGNEAKGRLEIYRPDHESWAPACVKQWDIRQASKICYGLGYVRVNYANITTTVTGIKYSPRFTYQGRQRPPTYNAIREFASCEANDYQTVDMMCTEYMCGRARPGTKKRVRRIVGGVPSRPGDWPFLAALLGGPEEIFYCAGVLISDQWVLTASHCVGNYTDVTGWTIQLGITRRHAHSFYGQKMKVKRVVPHPRYNIGIAHDNDVALFQLSHKVTYHEHLMPVCLPKRNAELQPGTICTVIGWGKKNDTGKYEPEINEVEVPILDRDECNHWLTNREMNVTDGMICAGLEQGGKDACQGDSGGPLLCRQPEDLGRWYVGGIVSWGIKCAHPRLPGVYAYVPKYMDWIQAKMKQYSN